MGTDFRQFVRSGAAAVGVGLSPRSLRLAKRALEASELNGAVMTADGGYLPFAADRFDLVYSWRVIHHSPQPERLAGEIDRVPKPGGEVLAMVYNLQSIVALHVWVYYVLLRGRPFLSPQILYQTTSRVPRQKAFPGGR